MQFWIELALFTGKAFILVFAIAAILILFFALIARARHNKPLLSVENLNDKYDSMTRALKDSVLDEKALKADAKIEKKKAKAEKKNPAQKKRIFYVDFNGDIRASRVENLREEVTSILTIARPGTDEVVINLESPGGMVSPYGLAAAQLVRIREAGLQLTICVDKVAASGGYLMACVGHKILAAPFAVVGSIGVVAQVPNFHRLLKKHDVDFQEVTAGEFKRTLTMFGEVTEKGKSKFKEQIEDIHSLFKNFVQAYRPQLNLEEVATGEYWFGAQAKDKKLIDEIVSSDDYLFNQRDQAEIFKIEVKTSKTLSERISENVAMVAGKTLERVLERGQKNSVGLDL